MAVRQGAGELRQRVAIQSRTQTRTAHGGFTNTWSTLATVWASVIPVNAEEFADADKQNERVTHAVKIRYFAGLNSAMRFLYRDRTLNITSVRNLDERKKIIEALCIEVMANGVPMLTDDIPPVIVLTDTGNPVFVE